MGDSLGRESRKVGTRKDHVRRKGLGWGCQVMLLGQMKGVGVTESYR